MVQPLLSLLKLLLLCTMPASLIAQEVTLQLQGRTMTGGNESTVSLHLPTSETAIIICDMWDQHWCKTATKRVKKMATRMNKVVKHARSQGITIVHAPSSTMDHYADHPARKAILDAPEAPTSDSIDDWYYLDSLHEGSLPIDDSDGGCDDPKSDCVHCQVWSKQIGSIEIDDEDFISDSGREINNLFVAKGVKNVLLMGVHTNMCVLGRSFGIRSLSHLDYQVLLVRDLTDSMYNPQMYPHVSHSVGTDLVIEHIEQHWCPTITSDQLLSHF